MMIYMQCCIICLIGNCTDKIKTLNRFPIWLGLAMSQQQVCFILYFLFQSPFKSLDNGEVGQQNEAFNGVEMKGTSKPK